MKRQLKRAALAVLSCIITLAGIGRVFLITVCAEKTNTEIMYDEMVYWGESAAYLYYFAVNSGYPADSVLYYYSDKDTQEDIVKAQFEKAALYALIADFPEKEAIRTDEAEGYVYVKKEVMDTAASELYGIDMEKAVSYCEFFALSEDEYVFLLRDFGKIIPQSAAHAFYGDMMSGYMCLTENGTWVEPYEFDMFLMPVENGTYSNYRFSFMKIKVPESYKRISTSRAEEEMISVRLRAFLNHEPGNAFLSHDFTGTENPDGSVAYECEGRFLTADDMASYLCPNGDDTERKRVELGYIFKNGDHYIADYGEGLLEVRMAEDKALTFLRNRRYKK